MSRVLDIDSTAGAFPCRALLQTEGLDIAIHRSTQKDCTCLAANLELKLRDLLSPHVMSLGKDTGRVDSKASGVGTEVSTNDMAADSRG